ncbi:proteoglycan 4 isoform X3 [Hyperolius riggenbachi]|uniref:proteoglycan 4 isoform X3 n=1 Tax=Hyperolius riggenbachi TaxID=752182 RepID=UPI0035A3057B
MFGPQLLLCFLISFSLVSAQSAGSCVGRCGQGYIRADPCHCDYNCMSFMECCLDYRTVCTTEASCKGRCHEGFIRGQTCDCDPSCVGFGKCCPDYEEHCVIPTPARRTTPPPRPAEPEPDPRDRSLKPTEKPPENRTPEDLPEEYIDRPKPRKNNKRPQGKSSKSPKKKKSKTLVEAEEEIEESEENVSSSFSSSSSSSSVKGSKKTKKLSRKNQKTPDDDDDDDPGKTGPRKKRPKDKDDEPKKPKVPKTADDDDDNPDKEPDPNSPDKNGNPRKPKDPKEKDDPDDPENPKKSPKEPKQKSPDDDDANARKPKDPKPKHGGDGPEDPGKKSRKPTPKSPDDDDSPRKPKDPKLKDDVDDPSGKAPRKPNKNSPDANDGKSRNPKDPKKKEITEEVEEVEETDTEGDDNTSSSTLKNTKNTKKRSPANGNKNPRKPRKPKGTTDDPSEDPSPLAKKKKKPTSKEPNNKRKVLYLDYDDDDDPSKPGKRKKPKGKPPPKGLVKKKKKVNSEEERQETVESEFSSSSQSSSSHSRSKSTRRLTGKNKKNVIDKNKKKAPETPEDPLSPPKRKKDKSPLPTPEPTFPDEGSGEDGSGLDLFQTTVFSNVTTAPATIGTNTTEGTLKPSISPHTETTAGSVNKTTTSIPSFMSTEQQPSQTSTTMALYTSSSVPEDKGISTTVTSTQQSKNMKTTAVNALDEGILSGSTLATTTNEESTKSTHKYGLTIEQNLMETKSNSPRNLETIPATMDTTVPFNGTTYEEKTESSIGTTVLGSTVNSGTTKQLTEVTTATTSPLYSDAPEKLIQSTSIYSSSANEDTEELHAVSTLKASQDQSTTDINVSHTTNSAGLEEAELSYNSTSMAPTTHTTLSTGTDKDITAKESTSAEYKLSTQSPTSLDQESGISPKTETMDRLTTESTEFSTLATSLKTLEPTDSLSKTTKMTDTTEVAEPTTRPSADLISNSPTATTESADTKAGRTSPTNQSVKPTTGEVDKKQTTEHSDQKSTPSKSRKYDTTTKQPKTPSVTKRSKTTVSSKYTTTTSPVSAVNLENQKATTPQTGHPYHICDSIKKEAMKLRIPEIDLQRIFEMCIEVQQQNSISNTPSTETRQPNRNDTKITPGSPYGNPAVWNYHPGQRIIQIVEEINRRINLPPVTNLTEIPYQSTYNPKAWLLLLNKIRLANDPQMNLCVGAPANGMTTLQNGTMVVFRGHNFWTLNQGGVTGIPRKITEVWGVPSPIDTVFTRCNCGGKTFFFKGPQYWRFSNDVMDKGYPKEIVKGFGGLTGRVTAILPVAGFKTRPESVYFFKPGGTVQKYTFRQEQAKRCTKKKRPTVNYPIYSQKVQTVRFRFPRDIVRHRIQIHRTYTSVQQPLGILHQETSIRSTWRGIPSNIVSAVSLPNPVKQDGYDYYVFSKEKYYNINMSSKVAVKPPPQAEQKTTKDWYKCKE